MKIALGRQERRRRKWIEAEPTAAETSTKNSAAATGYGRSGGGKAAERTTPARRLRSGESVGRSCGLPYHIAANASPTPRLSQGAVPAPDPPPPPRRGARDGFPSARERRKAAAHPHRHSRGRETFQQPSFPRRRESRFGFPAKNASHLRHAVSHRGSYAKVSGRGNLSPPWCTITTLDAVHHSGGTNQVANLGSRRPAWRSTGHGASPGR